MKSRSVACALAFFLGGFGVHRFYTNRPVSGILYALFFWTFVPAILALFEAILFAIRSQEDFETRYFPKAS